MGYLRGPCTQLHCAPEATVSVFSLASLTKAQEGGGGGRAESIV